MVAFLYHRPTYSIHLRFNGLMADTLTPVGARQSRPILQVLFLHILPLWFQIVEYSESQDWSSINYLILAGLEIELDETTSSYYQSSLPRTSTVWASLPLTSHGIQLICQTHVQQSQSLSLKSLQILDDSVRDFNFASWRITYKVACLLVSTYDLISGRPRHSRNKSRLRLSKTGQSSSCPHSFPYHTTRASSSDSSLYLLPLTL